MLTLPDWTLFYWAIGKKEIPEDSEWKHSKVLGRLPQYLSFFLDGPLSTCFFSAQLSKHAANDGKSLRKMPEIQAYGIQGVQEAK